MQCTSEYEDLSSSGKVVENWRCTSSSYSTLRRKERSRNPAYLVVKKLFRYCVEPRRMVPTEALPTIMPNFPSNYTIPITYPVYFGDYYMG
jgi:hypothetical protein